MQSLFFQYFLDMVKKYEEQFQKRYILIQIKFNVINKNFDIIQELK